MQIGEQREHLLVREPPGKRRHKALPFQDYSGYLDIAGRRPAGKVIAVKKTGQPRRSFPEGKIVVLVTVGAANLVEVLALDLLLS